MGVHAAVVLTCATAQSSGGAEVFPIPPEGVEAQMRAARELEVGAAKLGMLGSPEAAKAVGELLGDYPAVLDPVVMSSAGHLLQDGDTLRAVEEHLFPRVTLVTPNLREAEVLSGVRIVGEDEAMEALMRLGEVVEGVLITGYSECADLLYWRGEVHRVPGRCLEGEFRGTGSTYAAAIAGYLAMGHRVPEAVARAKEFLQRCLRHARTSPLAMPDCTGSLRREAERYGVAEELIRGIEELVQIEGFPVLIPQVGSNFVYALPEAVDREEVAGLTGRIVRSGDRAIPAGWVSFGGSSHLSRVVIAAQRVRPEVRAALNVRYSDEVVEAARRAGLKVSSFSREEEPEGVSTMEWGTLRALERCRDAEVVYDTGGVGKEAMVRILGANPKDVLDKLRRLLHALGKA